MCVCAAQYAMGRVLSNVGKTEAAEQCFKDVFDHALKVQGPQGANVQSALRCYQRTLFVQDKQTEAEAVTFHAGLSGCDNVLNCFGGP